MRQRRGRLGRRVDQPQRLVGDGIGVSQLEWQGRRLGGERFAQRRRYSRSLLVCERLTGISVDFPSLIFRM